MGSAFARHSSFIPLTPDYGGQHDATGFTGLRASGDSLMFLGSSFLMDGAAIRSSPDPCNFK
jgi:hypothetical protein